MRDNTELKKIGNKVKLARMARGINVRKLGKMCHVDYSNLSRFENGQVNVGVLLLISIADKLEVDIKDFLQKN